MAKVSYRFDIPVCQSRARLVWRVTRDGPVIGHHGLGVQPQMGCMSCQTLSLSFPWRLLPYNASVRPLLNHQPPKPCPAAVLLLLTLQRPTPPCVLALCAGSRLGSTRQQDRVCSCRRGPFRLGDDDDSATACLKSSTYRIVRRRPAETSLSSPSAQVERNPPPLLSPRDRLDSVMHGRSCTLSRKRGTSRTSLVMWTA